MFSNSSYQLMNSTQDAEKSHSGDNKSSFIQIKDTVNNASTNLSAFFKSEIEGTSPLTPTYSGMDTTNAVAELLNKGAIADVSTIDLHMTQ